MSTPWPASTRNDSKRIRITALTRGSNRKQSPFVHSSISTSNLIEVASSPRSRPRSTSPSLKKFSADLKAGDID
ncbi:hypothetical protein PPTG_23299 [Phytophthora nicotianae INRA-310]|uniref:Uncharacterized protein n=1 Tax=Phytophthora nicotianae (strain INRA-310) TaxID=761204 RepID=W2Q2F7_PHYN3|nr:hypothetical protein PPTG_23299 [Phytophthora nicotianae INRA-310]ETN06460.1 hypothetical protein PPTG_23299 [Phytophthora nicotianae INRA-310]